MLLKEQVRTIYKGMTSGCSPETFRRNSRFLMREHGLPRHTALAFAYSKLMRNFEQSAKSARAETGATECIRHLLTRKELEEASRYSGFLGEEDREMDTKETLDLLRQTDITGTKPMQEQENEGVLIDKAVAQVEAELQKSIVVSLARVLDALGYARWPRDEEGRERVEKLVDAMSKRLMKMGRRFNNLLRNELRALRMRGPKSYERIYRRWLAGAPSEIVADETPVEVEE